MIVGIIGRMRSGKTLLQSILAVYFAQTSKMRLFANYSLQGAEIVKTTRDIWSLHNCIFCFDEIWLTMDSRFFKDNTSLSHWIMQTAKRNVLVIYTSQARHQVDLRLRGATDLFILANKAVQGHSYTFLQPDLMDENVFLVGRKYNLIKPQEIYHIFNSFQLMWPIEYIKMTPADIRQISEQAD